MKEESDGAGSLERAAGVVSEEEGRQEKHSWTRIYIFICYQAPGLIAPLPPPRALCAASEPAPLASTPTMLLWAKVRPLVSPPPAKATSL